MFVALTITVPELAFFLLSPIGGALADRIDRRRLMIAADLARAALCLPLLLVDSPGTVWLVFVLLASISVFTACFEPASRAAVPNVVDPEDLAAANSLVGSAWGTMLAVGAALGGLVVTLFGRDAAFLGNTASFLRLGVAAAPGAAGPLRARARSTSTHPGILEATRETVAYARRDHRVLSLLGVKAGFGLAAGVLVLIAVFATDVFHEGDIGIGLLMASRGVGALIGPFLGRSLAGADDRRLFTAIGLALAVFGTAYMMLGLSPSLLVAAPIVLVRAPGRRLAVDALHLRPAGPHARPDPRTHLRVRLRPGHALPGHLELRRRMARRRDRAPADRDRARRGRAGLGRDVVGAHPGHPAADRARRAAERAAGQVGCPDGHPGRRCPGPRPRGSRHEEEPRTAPSDRPWRTRSFFGRSC